MTLWLLHHITYCLCENVDLWTLCSGISKFGFTGQKFLIETRQRLMCFVNQSDNLFCFYSVVHHRANHYFLRFIVCIYYGFSLKPGKDWCANYLFLLLLLLLLLLYLNCFLIYNRSTIPTFLHLHMLHRQFSLQCIIERYCTYYGYCPHSKYRYHFLKYS